MTFKSLKTILLLSAIGVVTACAPQEVVYEFPSSSNNLYFCDQSRQMTATIGPNAQAAIVLYDSRNHRLPRLPSETEIYSDGTWTLLFNELGIAALEYEGVPVLTGCSTEAPNRPERSVGKKIFSGAYD